MTIRTVFVGLTALALSSASANAQAKTTKPVVISQAVLKSLTANKSKSKTPLGARVGIGRKSTAVAVKPVQLQPTSVSEIAKKK